MAEPLEFVLRALVIGGGATVAMDVWAMFRQRLFGQRGLDYALVGRWLGHLARGRFRHHSIGASPLIAGERLLGWSAHYAIGIAFAAVLLAIWGLGWARGPTLGPALAVGIGSVAAPFFVMQPALGFGVAASRSPRPWAARWQSLATHAVFGLGLYASAWLTKGWRVPLAG
jgi:hypothetical protein